MRNPENIKEIQKLIGRLTTLSIFMPKLAEKTKSIIQLLWKSPIYSASYWTLSILLNFLFYTLYLLNIFLIFWTYPIEFAMY